MTAKIRGKRAGALVGVLAAAAIIGGAMAVSSGGGPAQTAGPSAPQLNDSVVLAPRPGSGGALPRGGVRPPGGRCEDARDLSMTQLKQQSFPLPVLLPDSMSDEMSAAWVCPDEGDQPIVMYGNVELSWDAGWAGVDLKSKFTEMASLRPHAEYTTFGKFGAYVNYPSEAAPLATAIVVVGDESVLIRSSDTTAMDSVLTIAKDIAASVPAKG